MKRSWSKIEWQITAVLAPGDIVRMMVYAGQGLEEKVCVITAVSIATREIKMETVGGRVWVRLDDVAGVDKR